MSEWGFIVAAYLLGSISFGIVVSRAFGLPDPRTIGSGNPGATNVLRSGKKAAAALTLLGDAAKGWLAVWLAQRLGFAPAYVALSMVAVFGGHLYPVFYGFKGGKGVATAFGILLALSPWLGLSVCAAWLLTFAVFRVSSLSALVAAALSPVFAFALFGVGLLSATVLALALALIWRHKSNIRKLLDGTEAGFSKSKTASKPGQ